MNKDIEILDLVEELSNLRKGIPQFLFSEAIHPNSMVAVRQDVIDYLADHADAKEIDFIINSPGGSPADAYRIIRTLRNNFEKVNVIVPFWAKSAATLLTLGATQIIMDEFGEFGPLDLQIAIERDDSPEIDRESALNDEYSVRRIEARSQEMYNQMFLSLYSNNNIKINKIELSKQLFEFLASFYKPLLSQINPYHLGRKKRMLDIGEQYAERILSMYYPALPERNKYFLIDYLVNRCPDHGYVIDFNVFSQYLLNVKKSSAFGKDYESVLSQLSVALMNNDDFNFIGFVFKDDSEDAQDGEVVADESQNDNEILPIPDQLQEMIANELDTPEIVDKQLPGGIKVTKKT